jgi:serine/threonine-protein kinase
MPDPITRLNAALEGRYRIERELGEGGMATVYLADDLKHERKVALKVLKPELAAVVGAERFLAEIKTTANLQHPHILPLHDSGEADEFLYYVMPHVDGESVRERLDRERQLPVKEAVAVAEAVASALDYAHRNDVIHRDIKPGNILLHDGNPVVADFGIALAVSAAGGGRMTETGLSLGTPHYMSPEQAAADRDLSARSDVYSLACVLYEMLAGDPPHTGPTPQSVLMRILTEEPRPIVETRKSVPPHVAASVAKGLEKLPADRFGSAAEFRQALSDESFTYATTGHRTEEDAAFSQHRGGGGSKRTPWLADLRSKVALGALLIAAVLLGREFVPGAADTDLARSTAPVTLFEVQLGDLEVPSYMALSPDGSTLVFASQASGGLPQLYLRRSDDVGIEPLPGTQNASEPVFSPDGDWIAFVVNGVELKRIPTQGGSPVLIATQRPILSAPAWGPDGSILFAGQQGLYEVPFDGGQPTQILASPLFSSRLPRHVLGNRVLFTHLETTSTDPEVRLLDLRSGEVRPLTPGRDARYLRDGHLMYVASDGSMVAVPFDSDRGELAGPPTTITDEVAVGPIDGDGLSFTLAESGAAVYAAGNSSLLDEVLVTVDLAGNETPIRGLVAGNFSAPRFDPTGRYLAFELDGSLWIRDLVLGRQDLLHEAASYNPIWSTDGTRIAFGYRLPTDEGSQLLIRDSDLASPPDEHLESRDFAVPSAWTPDGSTLLYSEVVGQDATAAEIWTTDPQARGTREPYLNADGWSEGFASLSPDGRWAAYESDEEGRRAVYVRTFPEPGEKIKVSEGSGLGARWSADGRRIFYRNGDTTKVANVRTEPTFAVVSHESLFTGPYRGVDPHPNGTHVVAIKRIGAGGGPAADRRLYFVVNWLDGVEALLGVGR